MGAQKSGVFENPKSLWIMAAVPACLLSLAISVYFVGQSRNVVFTQRDYDRIRLGMTRSEVETQLRMPPGNYRTDGVDWAPFCMGDLGKVEWLSDEGEILVRFDESARVEECQFNKPPPCNRSWLLRLRAWIGI